MPLVRLVIPMILGIVTYLISQTRVADWCFVSIYLILICIWVSLRGYWLSHFSRRWVFGVMSTLMLYAVGYHLAQQNNQLYKEAHFSMNTEHEGYLAIRIREPVSEKSNSLQIVGEVLGWISPDHEKYLRLVGNIIVYLEKDSLAAALAYGDVIVTANSYEEVRPPQNPRQFNYKRFLANQNIFHTSYRQSGSWHHTGVNRGSSWKRWSLQLRESALTVFSEHQLQGREFAVISALLLGYREYLDEDLQREFAGAGAMHILCVSGLHVGIIFLVLKTMLSFLKKLPGGRFIQTGLILLLIWLYASITGLSPSVLRASAMFSFVAAGQSLSRRTNIYNTLAASAMVLIIIDPFIIMRIGFQLSYLAVISIVSIQPWLYKGLIIKNKLLDKAWGITTVSIAAQLATGPLSLLYFHQFPNYFLLTNLIVIPLSGLIIHSSLLTLALTPIPFVGDLSAKLLYGLLYALHASVKHIEALPYSTSTNVYIGIPETMLLFVFMIFVCIYLIAKRRMGMKVAFAALLLMVGCFSLRSLHLYRQEHFVVYSVNNASVIDFFMGREKVVLACERAINEPQAVDFQTSEYRISRGIKQPVFRIDTRFAGISIFKRPLMRSVVTLAVDSPWQETFTKPASLTLPPVAFELPGGKQPESGYPGRESPATAVRHGHYIHFGGKILLIVTPNHTPIQQQNHEGVTFPVDYLIVCQNPRVSPAAYLAVFTPSKVILDASNNRWNVSRWEAACDSLDVMFWSVRERGAFHRPLSSSLTPGVGSSPSSISLRR